MKKDKLEIEITKIEEKGDDIIKIYFTFNKNDNYVSDENIVLITKEDSRFIYHYDPVNELNTMIMNYIMWIEAYTFSEPRVINLYINIEKENIDILNKNNMEGFVKITNKDLEAAILEDRTFKIIPRTLTIENEIIIQSIIEKSKKIFEIHFYLLKENIRINASTLINYGNGVSEKDFMIYLLDFVAGLLNKENFDLCIRFVIKNDINEFFKEHEEFKNYINKNIEVFKFKEKDSFDFKFIE